MTDKQELKDVLHLYLGCEVQTKIRRETSKGQPMRKLKGRLCDFDLLVPNCVGIHLEDEKYDTDTTSLPISDIKPILRPLSDMTDKEIKDIQKLTLLSYNGCHTDSWVKTNTKYWLYEAQRTKYLLKQGFDLFGLIESGQAIDKTTLK